MQHNIKYSGITTRPSDSESPDGDLGLCVNLINEDGSLKPILPFKKQFSLDYYLQGQDKKKHRLLYVHKVQEVTLYILLDGNSGKMTACKLSEGLIDPVYNFTVLIRDIISITSIGATLIITSKQRGVSYALYKEDKYVYLGEKPPFVDLSFGLTGKMVEKRFILYDGSGKDNIIDSVFFETINDVRSLKRDYTTYSLTNSTTKEQYEDALSENLIPTLNEFVRINSIEAGKLMMPFFIRYAYRLYDGTHIMHSAPVLMLPNSKIAAFITGGEVFSQAMIDAELLAMACDINYCSVSASVNIRQWEDIIVGVDVFISSPIYTFDQNGKVTGWRTDNHPQRPFYDYKSNASLSTIKASSEDYSLIIFKPGYHKNFFPPLFLASMGSNYPNDEWAMTNIGKGYRFPHCYIKIPQKTDKDISKEITSASLFYKVATLSIEDVFTYTEKTTRKTLDIPADILKTLEQRERLTDDYMSHNQIRADYSYAYNSRLYLANVSQQLFKGFSTTSLLQYDNTYSDFTDDVAYVFIKKEGREFVLMQKTPSQRSFQNVNYLFYPDPDAYKMVLKTGYWTLEFILTPSDFLHGAYWFGNFIDVPLVQKATPTATNNNILYTPNKLFSSSVNNPFHFPPECINDIGTNARILAISSTTKALSQGQFGQFPLYVFKEDGVWAVKIGDNGAFLESHPVTRDVLNNRELLQIDGGIVFSTQQGLMLLSGAESIPISDVVDEKNIDISKLPHLNDILLAMNRKDLTPDIVPFKEYITTCRLAYDYANSRIYVTNENHAYAYVYSLKSNLWSITKTRYMDVVNNYPTSLLVDENQDVYDTSQLQDIVTQGVLITRPFKLDAQDTLKTIREAIHRSVGGRIPMIKSALYGSMNCYTYYLVSSSNDDYIRRIGGTPYKYFVFVISTNFRYGDELLGTSIVFDIKRNNKLR